VIVACAGELSIINDRRSEEMLRKGRKYLHCRFGGTVLLLNGLVRLPRLFLIARRSSASLFLCLAFFALPSAKFYTCGDPGCDPFRLPVVQLLDAHTKLPKAFQFVAVLGPFLLRGHHDTRGPVHEPHACFHLVHMLAALAARAEGHDLAFGDKILVGIRENDQLRDLNIATLENRRGSAAGDLIRSSRDDDSF
jgi:hypothetical protein